MDIADRAEQQIASQLEQAVARLRKPTSVGGCKECVECGAEIPTARRLALPHVRTCINCAQQGERQSWFRGSNQGSNRRWW